MEPASYCQVLSLTAEGGRDIEQMESKTKAQMNSDQVFLDLCLSAKERKKLGIKTLQTDIKVK